MKHRMSRSLSAIANSAGILLMEWSQHKLRVSLLCCMVILLQSCSTVTRQSVSEIDNGPFKVMVRTQEFNNSGSEIVDVCVANTGSHEFPDHPDKHPSVS